MAKIKAVLEPTALRRMLYNRPMNVVRNFMNGNNLWYRELNRETQAIQKDILFAHNLETLKASMKSAGFSLNMDNVLERMLKQNFPSFHIRYADPLHQKDTDFTGVNKEVTLQIDSHQVKAVIAAAPQPKTVLLTEKNGQYLNIDRLMERGMSDMTRKLSVVSEEQGEDMVIDMNQRRNRKTVIIDNQYINIYNLALFLNCAEI
jgi:hypothetical protein